MANEADDELTHAARFHLGACLVLSAVALFFRNDEDVSVAVAIVVVACAGACLFALISWLLDARLFEHHGGGSKRGPDEGERPATLWDVFCAWLGLLAGRLRELLCGRARAARPVTARCALSVAVVVANGATALFLEHDSGSVGRSCNGNGTASGGVAAAAAAAVPVHTRSFDAMQWVAIIALCLWALLVSVNDVVRELLARAFPEARDGGAAEGGDAEKDRQHAEERESALVLWLVCLYVPNAVTVLVLDLTVLTGEDSVAPCAADASSAAWLRHAVICAVAPALWPVPAHVAVSWCWPSEFGVTDSIAAAYYANAALWVLAGARQAGARLGACLERCVAEGTALADDKGEGPGGAEEEEEEGLVQWGSGGTGDGLDDNSSLGMLLALSGSGSAVQQQHRRPTMAERQRSLRARAVRGELFRLV